MIAKIRTRRIVAARRGSVRWTSARVGHRNGHRARAGHAERRREAATRRAAARLTTGAHCPTRVCTRGRAHLQSCSCPNFSLDAPHVRATVAPWQRVQIGRRTRASFGRSSRIATCDWTTSSEPCCATSRMSGGRPRTSSCACGSTIPRLESARRSMVCRSRGSSTSSPPKAMSSPA